MDSIKDLLNKKAADLDIDAKRDESALIEKVLSRYFESGLNLLRITPRRNAIIKVRNSSLASELRMQQIIILEDINRILKVKIDRIVIRQ